MFLSSLSLIVVDVFFFICVTYNTRPREIVITAARTVIYNIMEILFTGPNLPLRWQQDTHACLRRVYSSVGIQILGFSPDLISRIHSRRFTSIRHFRVRRCTHFPPQHKKISTRYSTFAFCIRVIVIRNIFDFGKRRGIVVRRTPHVASVTAE